MGTFVEELVSAKIPNLDAIVRACSWLFRSYINIGSKRERIVVRHWFTLDLTFNPGVMRFPLAFMTVMTRHFEVMALAKITTTFPHNNPASDVPIVLEEPHEEADDVEEVEVDETAMKLATDVIRARFEEKAV